MYFQLYLFFGFPSYIIYLFFIWFWLKHTQPEEEDKDDDITERPPLKKYFRRSVERESATKVYNNISPSCSSTMSMDFEEVPTLLLMPADPMQAEKDSNAGALIILDDEPFVDHKPMIPGIVCESKIKLNNLSCIPFMWL